MIKKFINKTHQKLKNKIKKKYHTCIKVCIVALASLKFPIFFV